MYELRKQLELLPQKLIEQLAISFPKINPEQKGWNTPHSNFEITDGKNLLNQIFQKVEPKTWKL